MIAAARQSGGGRIVPAVHVGGAILWRPGIILRGAGFADGSAATILPFRKVEIHAQ
jgi:hypothetical protein